MSTPALLTALNCKDQVHLIIGSNPLAGARCSKSIEVGANPKLIAPADATLHYGLQKRIEEGQVEWLKKEFEDEDLRTYGRDEIEGYADAVFVTLGATHALSQRISTLCRKTRVPVNVADAPSLCTFSLLSTYNDGPLQVGTTTSGKGCKLASRIRREIAASLPRGLGAAVERLGSMRRRIWEEDYAAELSRHPSLEVEVGEEDSGQSAAFNQLVTSTDAEVVKQRRIRWLAQICEYWPLQRLVNVTEHDIDAVLRSYATNAHPPGPIDMQALDARHRRGKIILAGSGPGNPDLLTMACRKAIASADLILADKLVPAPVMEIIPRRAEVHIARKFPGNADRAQEELLGLGLQGLRQGRIVLRLKQGDPYLYGRGAEEYDFFRSHGYEAAVIPGITSALSAPLFASIPATHRAVADEVLVCTGTGRKGAAPDPPAYVATRTVVFLMALHRLGDLVASLLQDVKKWPASTPCAVIERASCPDQRVVRTTLEYVCAAVEEEGSRPPGLLVVGQACKVLWNGQQRWVVEDGFKGLDDVDGLPGEQVPLPLEVYEDLATPG
ncbi:MAG: hypothetical protein Q9159_003252 [Coniocarpon cinnabarinum]